MYTSSYTKNILFSQKLLTFLQSLYHDKGGFLMKFKKLFAVGMSVALAAVMLAGCSSNESTADHQGKIIIGLDDNFPPMGFHNKSGELVGFDIDLAKATAKKLGREVEFKPIEWSAKEAELTSGRVDALWNGLSVTPEREKNITFTQPYMKDEQIIVVLRNSPIKTKADLAGKVVGVQDGSTSLIALEKDKPVYDSIKEVKKYADNVTALMDEKDNRIDALVVDSVVGRYYIKSMPEVYRILDQNFGVEYYAVGLKKGNVELQKELNKAFDELRKDGTMAEISKKWFGDNITM